MSKDRSEKCREQTVIRFGRTMCTGWVGQGVCLGGKGKLRLNCDGFSTQVCIVKSPRWATEGKVTVFIRMCLRAIHQTVQCGIEVT